MGNLRFMGNLACLCLGGAAGVHADYVWDDTSPLIHTVDEDLDPLTQRPTLGIAPWFQELVPDFLYLVKRSYNATKRSDRTTYRLPAEMMQAQVDIGEHIWHCRQNFAGTQGAIRTPYSSPTTENTKSAWASGTKRFTTPSPGPQPNQPPW
jgi:hypothetical protein